MITGLAWVLLLGQVVAHSFVQDTNAEDPASVNRVLELLNWLESSDPGIKELTTLGERAFPAYESIIKNPRSEPTHVARALDMITFTKGDRSRFLDPTIQRLDDPSLSIRSAALELLAEIGSDRDTGPILATLSDDDKGVRRRAAKVLGKLGGKRDLVAIDIWVKTGNNRDDGVLMQLLKKSRDEIEKRLKEQPIPKDLKD